MRHASSYAVLVSILGVASSASAVDAVSFGDFDGDHKVDVALGMEQEDAAGVVAAGFVEVYSQHDLDGALGREPTKVINQGTLGLPPAKGERFGTALATADFNHDGYDDLAIGVPGWDFSSTAPDAGIVHVLYGAAATGLRTTVPASFSLGTRGVPGAVQAGGLLGSALAAGDFNHDGYDDLAVGAPGMDVTRNSTPFVDAGQALVLYGSTTGLRSSGSRVFGQDVQGVEGASEAGDHFAAALATGDVNGDSFDELIVGVPDESIGSVTGAGAVQLFYGASGGLDFVSDQIIDQNTSIPGVADRGDAFGSSVATGDLNGDGLDDLVIGIPNEDLNRPSGFLANAGMVAFVHGNRGARLDLSSTSGAIEGDGLLGGAAKEGNRLGYRVATGDLDNDGFDDVAVSAPWDPFEDFGPTGSFHVLYGSSAGVGSARYITVGVLYPADLNDYEAEGSTFTYALGKALAFGDVTGDGLADLAAGTGLVDSTTWQWYPSRINVLDGSADREQVTAHSRGWF